MKKNNFVTSLLGTIALIIIVFVAYNQFNSYLRVRSVNECMQAAKVELQSDVQLGETNYVTTRTQPIAEWYDRCMKEKGYTTVR